MLTMKRSNELNYWPKREMSQIFDSAKKDLWLHKGLTLSLKHYQGRISGCWNIQNGVQTVNYYHKALHLGCRSSPRSASDYVTNTPYSLDYYRATVKVPFDKVLNKDLGNSSFLLHLLWHLMWFSSSFVIKI